MSAGRERTLEAAPAPVVTRNVPPRSRIRIRARRGAVGRRSPIGPFPRQALRWRLLVITCLVATLAALRVGRTVLDLQGRPAGPWFEAVASYGSTLWAIPVIPALCTIAGMLLWRGPLRGLPAGVADADTTSPFPEIAFRIVARGTNPETLAATVTVVRAAMAEFPLFRHRIEVVTDVAVELPDGPDLHAFVVPESYETPRGSRYKARALHYAVEQSTLPDDAWVLHLDEESQPTHELIVGIHDFVATAHEHPNRTIGQGIIRYDRMIDRHPFLTAADMIRTGDDVGRYHLQHRLGFTIFGLHGSFILVRNDVLRTVGFDVGPEGSITEDAFWALRQMANGQRCRWVDGDLVEQSTESLGDFVKQRRRWFAGMLRVVLYADVQPWIRVPLALFTALWSTAWASMAFTVVNLFLGLETPPLTATLGDITYATYVTTYVLGLWLNLRHHPELGIWQRSWRYVLQVAGMPLFAVMEGLGVLAAMVRPERGFHVVEKSART